MSKPLTTSALNEFFKADAKRSGLSPFPPSMRKGEGFFAYAARVNEHSRAHYEDDLGKPERFAAFMAEREKK